MHKTMKKNIFYLILYILIIFSKPLASFSQNWLPNGAIWHTGIIESFFSTNQGYIFSSIVGDSTLLSKGTRIILSNHYDSRGILIKSDTNYMYEDTGKIFNFTSGQFYKLYDYNLMPGDTWQISVPYPSPYIVISMTSPDTVVTIKVDSISSTLIDGQLRKLQYVHSINNDWYFLNPAAESSD